MCFCIVETHHPDRVLRKFELVQEEPAHVEYNEILHAIDLHGKVDKNWRVEHAPYIRDGILDNNDFVMHLLRLVRCPVIMPITAGTVRSLESMSTAGNAF